MGPGDIHQIISDTIWVILIGAGPILVLALLSGLAIALFQALTSVQDMTLTFVPKVALILIGVIMCLPLIYVSLSGLSEQVFGLIVHDGF